MVNRLCHRWPTGGFWLNNHAAVCHRWTFPTNLHVCRISYQWAISGLQSDWLSLLCNFNQHIATSGPTLAQRTKRWWPTGGSLRWANGFAAGDPQLGCQWTVIWGDKVRIIFFLHSFHEIHLFLAIFIVFKCNMHMYIHHIYYKTL